jgi:hypothetical protein
MFKMIRMMNFILCILYKNLEKNSDKAEGGLSGWGIPEVWLLHEFLVFYTSRDVESLGSMKILCVKVASRLPVYWNDNFITEQ